MTKIGLQKKERLCMSKKTKIDFLNEHIGLNINFRDTNMTHTYRAKVLRFFEEDGEHMALIELEGFWEPNYKVKTRVTSGLKKELALAKKRLSWSK